MSSFQHLLSFLSVFLLYLHFARHVADACCGLELLKGIAEADTVCTLYIAPHPLLGIAGNVAFCPLSCWRRPSSCVVLWPGFSDIVLIETCISTCHRPRT
jgi:hypothetical protein